jgi:hypothetical protein
MPTDDTPDPSMPDAGASPPRRAMRLPGGRSTHGLGGVGTLVRAASRARLDAFDRRTVAGRLLHEARRDFVAHLGGADELSAAEAALVERLAMRRLVLALVDEMLLKAQATGTPRDVLEVARHQAALDQGYVAMLRELGWKRKPKPVPDLATYLVSKKDSGPSKIT